ncbi:MAG TPA: DUF6464 family protein [Candidatus Obscuribacterales bacterium]
MFEAILIFVISLMPPLLSVWVMRKAEAQARARLRAAMELTAVRRLQITPLPPEHQYLEGIGYLIGDITCQFNACSGYIRCAVNPSGPCEGCRHYQPKDYTI